MKKSWWHRWTVDRPAAFGDWLWLTLVVKPADFLNDLTLRQAVTFIPLVLIAIVFAQTLPLDLAILFAGDTLMYLEALTILSMLAATGRARIMWRMVRRIVGEAIVGVGKRFAPVIRREGARQRRANGALGSMRRLLGISEKSDDDGGPRNLVEAFYAMA